MKKVNKCKIYFEYMDGKFLFEIRQFKKRKWVALAHIFIPQNEIQSIIDYLERFKNG